MAREGNSGEEPEEILTSFRSRRWEPEREGRPWLAAIVVVAASLGAAYLWLRSPEPPPEVVGQPVPEVARDGSGAPVALPTMRPDRSSPVTPRPAGQVAFYECSQGGQRVLSDRPCGPDAVERVVDTGELNTFSEVAPVVAPRPSGAQVRAPSPVRQAGAAPGVDRQEQLCRSIQDRIDYINARTRQKHSHREGEFWRAEWHKAKNAYYDAGCGRPG